MDKLKHQHLDSEIATSSQADDKRKGEERRKLAANGFTRIPIVGWICRREIFRRVKDTQK